MAVADVEVVELLTGCQTLHSHISDIITGFTKQNSIMSYMYINCIDGNFIINFIWHKEPSYMSRVMKRSKRAAHRLPMVQINK